MKPTGIPRIKKINLRKKILRRRRLYASKTFWRMRGGPLKTAWLCTPGTLIFSIPGWHGYYDVENNWVEL